MRHRVKSTKFKYGSDANKMLTRKLLRNFVEHGRLTSTEKKVKLVKREVEKLVHLAKKESQAARRLLTKRLADKHSEELLLKSVAPVFKERVSGFTTLINLTQRDSDGAFVARLQWSLPVVIEKPIKKPAKKEEVKKEAAATKTTEPEKKKLSKQVKSTSKQSKK